MHFIIIIIIIIIIIVTIIIFGSAVLGGPWTPQAKIASNLYPGQPPANFCSAVYLRLPLLRKSFLISLGHVLVDLQGFFSTIVNAFKRNVNLITFLPGKWKEFKNPNVIVGLHLELTDSKERSSA